MWSRDHFSAKVKQRLVKQRLEFSTFLQINFVKVYACNSILNEDYVLSNTMCTQAPPQSLTHGQNRPT